MFHVPEEPLPRILVYFSFRHVAQKSAGKSPSQLHEEQVARFGASAYARIDAPATKAQKAKLAALSPQDVTATELAGEPINSRKVYQY